MHAPALYDRLPTTPVFDEAADDYIMQGVNASMELPWETALADAAAALDALRAAPEVTGPVGVVGFCYGGAIANFLATRLPSVAAAAPFYGSAPAIEDVANIKAELLVVLAENDERVNASWPPYEAALKAAGVHYTLLQPPGTQHGFNNDTTPRYDKAAAAEAWKQTIALFNRTLR